MSKLWGGRFEGTTDKAVEEFTSSFALDYRLWAADLKGSAAHARALKAAGVLTADETAQIVGALETIGKSLADQTAPVASDAEDIHSEIERLLNALVGGLS